MEKRIALKYGLLLLCLGIMIVPGTVLDFKPSEELAKYSAFLGLVIAAGFWPLIKVLSNKSAKSRIGRFFLAFMIFPIFIALFGFGATIGTLGYAANRVIGKPHMSTEIVERLGCSGRRCFCATRVNLTSNTIMSNGTFCIEDGLWHQLIVGQKIRLTGISSRLGFDVDKFEVVR